MHILLHCLWNRPAFLRSVPQNCMHPNTIAAMVHDESDNATLRSESHTSTLFFCSFSRPSLCFSSLLTTKQPHQSELSCSHSAAHVVHENTIHRLKVSLLYQLNAHFFLPLFTPSNSWIETKTELLRERWGGLSRALCCALRVGGSVSFDTGLHDDARVFFLMDHIVRVTVFAFLSAVFAGLTLGVMCADTFTLEIIAESGPMPLCTYASTILPLRKQGHKTLCTLIISNMLCNVLIVQEFNRMFDSAAAASPGGDEGSKGSTFWKFTISTLFIVLFTEIVPMSICKSKHSLRVAAAGSVFVRVAMLITYPIAVPLGKLLDVIVGATENGQIYDKKELRRLMVVHYERQGDKMNLPPSELKLLLAAMDFQESTVGDIMTPMERVTMVDEDEAITPDFVERVWMSGRSRVPVRSSDGQVRHILMAKDLIGFRRFSRSTTVLEVVQTKGRVFALVGERTTLPAMLKFFQDTKIHMAVVFAENEELTEMDASKHSFTLRHKRRDVGLITLEDVVEKLLNDQIYDEYDSYDPIAHDAPSSRAGIKKSRSMTHSFASHMLPEPLQQPRVNFYSYFTHPEASVPLSEAQVWGAAYFLHRAVKAFAMWTPSAIHLLLRECGDMQLVPPKRRKSFDTHDSSNTLDEPCGELKASETSCGELHMALRTNISHEELRDEIDDRYILYQRGVPSEVFTLVLGGRVDLLLGCDCIHSTLRSFEFLGEDALLSLYYTPDCTAVVQRPARIFRIPRSHYDRIFSAVYDHEEQAAHMRCLQANAPMKARGGLETDNLAGALRGQSRHAPSTTSLSTVFRLTQCSCRTSFGATSS
eukprot:gene12512-8568_t